MVNKVEKLVNVLNIAKSFNATALQCLRNSFSAELHRHVIFRNYTARHFSSEMTSTLPVIDSYTNKRLNVYKSYMKCSL